MKGKRDRDGIYLRKGVHWISWTDAQGIRRRRKTNAITKTQAREFRAHELLRVEQTRTLGFAPPGSDAFDSVAERFLNHQKRRLTNKAYEREKLIVNRHFKPFFEGLIAKVKQVDVERFVGKRSGEVSAHTVHKELQALKHLFRLAVSWQIVPISPAATVKSPKVPAGRLRYLQPTELPALLVECAEWLKPIVLLAVSSGMRQSEILNLRWLDIDINNRRILLPQTKNGDLRVVYLNDIAMSVIQALRPSQVGNSTDRLFRAGSSNRVSVAFARACRRAKIENFRFHDLRHTAASWMRMGGADIHTVAQILGHKDLRMAARYQHLSPDYLSNAVKRLDVVFADSLEGYRHSSVTTPLALPAARA